MKAYIPDLDIEEEVTTGNVYTLKGNADLSTFTAYTQDEQHEVLFEFDSIPGAYFGAPITDLYDEDEDAWNDQAQKQLDDFFGTHVQTLNVGTDQIITIA